MKITIGWKKTEFGYGRPKCCGDAPMASVELECPESMATEDLRKRMVSLFVAVRQEVERQCVASRPAREPGDDDDETDDIGPGDSAWERQQQAQCHPKHEAQPPKNWQNGYGNSQPANTGRPSAQQSSSGARPSGQQSNQGGKDFGPPRNPKQFLGWLNRQSDDVKARAYSIISDWELPHVIQNWEHPGRDKDARGLYDKLQAVAINGNGQH